MNVPNVLTIIRFFLVPAFAYAYLYARNIPASAIILAASGLTDFLDGFIARKYNLVTKWGTAFDPIADKFTQITVAFCIALSGYTTMWLIFGILVVKEVFMILGGIKLYKKGDIVMGANWYGKVATVMIYFVFLVLILFGTSLPEIVKYILFISVIGLSVFSFIRYAAVFVGMRKKLKELQ
ncbi:MAG: CDP-alcohol phosphatidyltransferase family protein [Clostridiaceae bacterium]|jgi:cardiolipin synthase|nr:CDP-alcohol phosphatidyltransferase family protein [Clostridiaceae bacterium]